MRLISEHDGPALDGLSAANRSLEQETGGPHGHGVVRLAAWSHRGVLNIICASAKGEPWSWEQLESAGASQNEKIDRAMKVR